MKIDQIAFYCADEKSEAAIKVHFGLQNAEWKQDTVTALSSIFGEDAVINIGHLQFNYDIGIEMEILRYAEDSEHWHLDQVWKQKLFGSYSPFISHVGIHLGRDDAVGWVEDFPIVDEKLFRLVQETWTQHHTNPFVVERGRLYHYRIYQCRHTQSYIKYIKRVAGV